jgi:hypothetical protein
MRIECKCECWYSFLLVVQNGRHNVWLYWFLSRRQFDSRCVEMWAIEWSCFFSFATNRLGIRKFLFVWGDGAERHFTIGLDVLFHDFWRFHLHYILIDHILKISYFCSKSALCPLATLFPALWKMNLFILFDKTCELFIHLISLLLCIFRNLQFICDGCIRYLLGDIFEVFLFIIRQLVFCLPIGLKFIEMSLREERRQEILSRNEGFTVKVDLLLFLLFRILLKKCDILPTIPRV